MPGPVFLAGDRVDLHTVEDEDLDFLERWRNDPRVRRWLPRAHPSNGERTRADFERYRSEEDTTVLLACDGVERLGLLTLFDVDHASGRGTLGAWLKPDAQGLGYGTAATTLLVDHAFGERRLEKLEAGALADNDASRALLEKIGFRQEGLQRSHYFVGGERVDRAAYGLTREEWDDA